jgi:hypothetical protein
MMAMPVRSVVFVASVAAEKTGAGLCKALAS